jgi:hypothetical protein
MSAAYQGNIMRSDGISSLIPLLLVLVVVVSACAAGCTTAKNTGAATATPASAPAAPAASSAGVISTTAVQKTADIDTTINVNFGDFSCLDVQQGMRVEYLYPDQKYTLSATSPGPGTVNVNVLFLDTNDNLKFRETEPKWDSVAKKWEYAGLVPLAKFDDVTGPVQKTFTIKDQGKYYICVDDRKETGVNDAIFHVPVKLLKLS